MPRIGTGTPSYAAIGLEATKGVLVTRDRYVGVKSNTIGAAFDVLRADIDTGERMTQTVIDILKGKVAGALGMSLFSNQGLDLMVNCLGNEVLLPAVASTPSTGVATTANGQVIYAVAATTAYKVGQLMLIGAPPNQILAQIAAKDVGHLTFRQFKANIPTAAGTPLVAPAQHYLTPRMSTDAFSYENPTHSIEANRGRQWAWAFPGCRDLKIEIKGAQSDVEVTHTIVGTEDPVYLGPTFFTANPVTVANRLEHRRPFTIRQGYAVVPNAQAGEAVGTTSLNRLVGLQDFTVDWDNFGVDKNFWDGDQRHFKDNYVTRQHGTVKYTYANASGRVTEYDEYLITEGAPAIPFFLTFVRNRATAAVPDWNGIGIHVPQMVVAMGNENPSAARNDVMTVAVEADMRLPDDGTPGFEMFVLNDRATAYLTPGTLGP